MALATITAKGQVTIPKTIRDCLKIHAGDKIEIILTKDREAIIRPISKKVDDIFCKLHKSGKTSVSIDAMEEAVKKRLREKFT
jgi:antitoxin PrlF